MAKLTKAQSKLHQQALSLVHSDRPLSLSEREFILDSYHPGATHINTIPNAHFTPRSLAHDLSIYIPDGGTTIDLCAGIGTLAYYAAHRADWNRTEKPRIVCVEINPEYVRVGKRVVPEATWICSDVFNLDAFDKNSCPPEILQPFDFAISNPPFSRQKRDDLPSPGSPLDLNVLAVAASIARAGAFILPQESCPFKYSGQRNHEYRVSPAYHRFRSTHDIELNCSSIDCSTYRDGWRDVSPNVEIALYDLDEQILNAASTDPVPATLWGNRLTTPDATIYVFDTPASASLVLSHIQSGGKYDTPSLFNTGLPLPVEVIKP